MTNAFFLLFSRQLRFRRATVRVLVKAMGGQSLAFAAWRLGPPALPCPALPVDLWHCMGRRNTGRGAPRGNPLAMAESPSTPQGPRS